MSGFSDMAREKEHREFLDRWAPEGSWERYTKSEAGRRFIFARMKAAEYEAGRANSFRRALAAFLEQR